MIKIKWERRTWTNLLRYLIDEYTSYSCFENDEIWNKHEICEEYIDSIENSLTRDRERKKLKELDFSICIIKHPVDWLESIEDYETNWKKKDVDFYDIDEVDNYLKEYLSKYSYWRQTCEYMIKYEDLVEDPEKTLSFLWVSEDISLPKKRIKPSWTKIKYFNQEMEIKGIRFSYSRFQELFKKYRLYESDYLYRCINLFHNIQWQWE